MLRPRPRVQRDCGRTLRAFVYAESMSRRRGHWLLGGRLSLLPFFLWGCARLGAQSLPELSPTRHVTLTPAPGEVSSAVVRGNVLYVGELIPPAVSKYSLVSGKKLGQTVSVGKKTGQVEKPFRLFSWKQGFAVYDLAQRKVKIFSPSWRFVEERSVVQKVPNGLWICDFVQLPAKVGPWLVGEGGCFGRVPPGEEGLHFFAFDEQGKLRPLLRWSPPKPDDVRAVERSSRTVLPLPSGGFVCVDTTEFRFFVFSSELALERSFPGSSGRWREPSWATYPKGYDRQMYFDWWYRQPQILGLFPGPGGTVGVVLRVGDNGEARYFFETYDLKTGKPGPAWRFLAPAQMSFIPLAVPGESDELWLFFRKNFPAFSPVEGVAFRLPSRQ